MRLDAVSNSIAEGREAFSDVLTAIDRLRCVTSGLSGGSFDQDLLIIYCGAVRRPQSNEQSDLQQDPILLTPSVKSQLQIEGFDQLISLSKHVRAAPSN